MTTTSTTGSGGDRLARTLNQLIVACNDGAHAQRAAAVEVLGPGRRAWLESSASRHSAWADELGALVRSLGGMPARGGSAFEGVRNATHWVDVQLVGAHGGDAYRSCARIETKVENLYKRAADGQLSDAARAVVARQQLGIAADRIELRRLSMGG